MDDALPVGTSANDAEFFWTTSRRTEHFDNVYRHIITVCLLPPWSQSLGLSRRKSPW